MACCWGGGCFIVHILLLKYNVTCTTVSLPPILFPSLPCFLLCSHALFLPFLPHFLPSFLPLTLTSSHAVLFFLYPLTFSLPCSHPPSLATSLTSSSLLLAFFLLSSLPPLFPLSPSFPSPIPPFHVVTLTKHIIIIQRSHMCTPVYTCVPLCTATSALTYEESCIAADLWPGAPEEAHAVHHIEVEFRLKVLYLQHTHICSWCQGDRETSETSAQLYFTKTMHIYQIYYL